MGASEWMRSVRAVRNTLVADYFAPGVNATHCVAYCPPIAVLLFLLALSVCYFKQTLWLWGQLWPCVGMGSLGTRLHRYCNGWHSTNYSSRSFYINLEERRKKVTRYHTTLLWGSTQSSEPTKSWKELMRRKVGDAVVEAVIERVWRYTWRLWLCELAGRNRASLQMHLEAVIYWVWGCPGTPWSSEFGHALGGRDGVNPEMHLEAMIEWVWSCTWRTWSSKFAHAPGGSNWASMDMHLEAEIKWTQRCTLRLLPSEFGDALAGYDRVGLEEYLEGAVNLGIMLYLVYAALCVNSWLWHGEIERDVLTLCS